MIAYLLLGLPFAYFLRKRYGWGTFRCIMAGSLCAMVAWLLIGVVLGVGA